MIHFYSTLTSSINVMFFRSDACTSSNNSWIDLFNSLLFILLPPIPHCSPYAQTTSLYPTQSQLLFNTSFLLWETRCFHSKLITKQNQFNFPHFSYDVWLFCILIPSFQSWYHIQFCAKNLIVAFFLKCQNLRLIQIGSEQAYLSQ